MKILSLEASTTSAKAMLYNTDTKGFDVLTREYVGKNDGFCRSAEDMYLYTLSLGRDIASGHDIDIISLGGTWHSVMACSSDMEPLSPVYLWNFTGASDICQSLRQDENYVRTFYKRTGCMVNAIYPAFKIKWLLQERPELQNERFLSLGTYFSYKMTGNIVSSRRLTSGSGLLNVNTGEYDEEILHELKLQPRQLSRLINYNDVFPLSGEAAALLDLRTGIPVIPTNPDGGLNQVGAGALKEGTATLSVGTSGAVRMTTGHPVIPEMPSTWCYRSPKAWLSGASTNGCCNCIDWAKNKLFAKGTSYSEMENGVTDPINTPVFLPFLFGERCPGWNDKRMACFHNCLPGHNVYDLYLAVQEGVLFNLFQCYTALTKAVGVPSEIKLSGGILNSPRWLQMCADILGCTLTLDNAVHGSLLGASVLAMEILGVIADCRDYSPAPSGKIEPNYDKAELYEAKFKRYLECYNK